MSDATFDSLAYMNAHIKDVGSRGLRTLAAEEHNGGSGGPGQLPTAEEAFLWRIVCERVYEEASDRGTAAATATGASNHKPCCALPRHLDASDKGSAAATATGAAAAVEAARATSSYDAVDSFLPETAVHMAALITAHVNNGINYRFGACQLMRIACRCMDWTDASSRIVAEEMLMAFMMIDPRSEAMEEPTEGQHRLAGCGGDGTLWESSVFALLLKVQSNGEELHKTMLSTVHRMTVDWALVTDSEAGEFANVANCAQDGCEATQPEAEQAVWLKCLSYVSLKHQHMSPRASNMREATQPEAEPSIWLRCLSYVSLMLQHMCPRAQKIGKIQDHIQIAVQIDIQVCVFPPLAGGATQPEAEPAVWLQCLSYVSLMLQHTSPRAPKINDIQVDGLDLNAVYSKLVLPATENKNEQVRILAFRCLGLFGLLPGRRSHLGGIASALCKELHEESSPHQDLRVTMVGSLMDLMLVSGLPVDALASKMANVELHQDGEAEAEVSGSRANAEDGMAANSCQQLSPIKLLLRLLRSCLEQMLHAATIVTVSSQHIFTALQQSPQLVHGFTAHEQDVKDVLSQLLVAHVHPASGECDFMRQCLAVFFEVSVIFYELGVMLFKLSVMFYELSVMLFELSVMFYELSVMLFEEYSSRSSSNMRHLSGSFMPAVKRATCINWRNEKKNPAVQLVKIGGQLLQLPVQGVQLADGESRVEDNGHGALSHQALVEMEGSIASGGKTKDWVKELCTLLPRLSVRTFNQREVKEAICLVQQCELASPDKSLLPSLLAFKELLGEVEETDAEPMTPEEVEALMQAGHRSVPNRAAKAKAASARVSGDSMSSSSDSSSDESDDFV
eukprot:gene8902-3788_t